MSATDQRRPQAGPYSGYYNRPPVEDDFLLTKVGPGTPCGEYLRRYWHPFLIASELKDLPLPVRLLGEDLVVFRDGSGRLGLSAPALRAPRDLARVRDSGRARNPLLLSRVAL